MEQEENTNIEAIEENLKTNTIEENNAEIIEEETIVEEEEEIKEPEPTPEQLAFRELVASLAELNLEKDDIVIFNNKEIGRIDSISINEEDLMYRIYVKVTDNLIITLDENFKNLNDNKGYDATKILSKDFINIKVEIEIENLILTIEEAQEELSKIKGQTVIIE